MTVVKREAKTSSSVNVAAGSEYFQPDRENYRFLYGKNMKVLEEDQESSGSSEDTDSSSPRSVVQLAKVRRWPAGKRFSPVRVHSQVLRIREEDSFIGDDVVGEYCLISTTAKEDHTDDVAAVMIFSNKPALPASPLGGKAAIKLVH